MTRYHDEPFRRIMEDLKQICNRLEPGQSLTFEAPHPDIRDALYPGETFAISNQTLRHRSIADWAELAEVLGCHLRCPTP